MAALGGAAMAGVESIEPSDGDSGAASVLAAAGAALEGVAGIDAQLDALADRFRAVTVEVDDLASELRRYAEDLDAEPGRLDIVEARLAALDRLKRKHGGSIAAVLEHAEECRRRRDELTGAEEALEQAEGRLAQARAELASLSAELHEARAAAGPAL